MLFLLSGVTRLVLKSTLETNCTLIRWNAHSFSIDFLRQPSKSGDQHLVSLIILLRIISWVCFAGTLIKTARHVNHDDDIRQLLWAWSWGPPGTLLCVSSGALMRTVPSPITGHRRGSWLSEWFLSQTFQTFQTFSQLCYVYQFSLFGVIPLLKLKVFAIFA